jgi:hypothetical protein
MTLATGGPMSLVNDTRRELRGGHWIMRSFRGVCAAVWVGLAVATGGGCSGGSGTTPEVGYLIGGQITDLRADGLVLHLGWPGGSPPDLSIPAGNTHFAFPQRVSTNTWYDLSIVSHPAGQKCYVAHGSGYVGSQSVTDILVFCSVPGLFQQTGAMVAPLRLDGHSATLLADHRVLIAGGRLWPTGDVLTSAELYDPISRTFAPTGSMVVARSGHTATLLDNGKVLMVGGSGGTAAELYDPATGAFTATGDTSQARTWSHSATRLKDGRVLVAGGLVMGGVGSATSSAEIFDPATGAFTPTGALAGPSYDHIAVLLPDGKILLAAGDGLDRAQLYDPASGTFSVTASMLRVRAAPVASPLADGTVLVVGGAGPPYGDYQTTAEIYDPVAGTFRATGETIACHAKATLLPSGKVFLSGYADWALCEGPGYDWGRTDAEVYDPATGTFGFTVNMEWARWWGHTASGLADGSVLIVGGAPTIDGVMEPSPELFLPH